MTQMGVFWSTFSSFSSLLSLIEAMNSLESLFPYKKECQENEIKYFPPVSVTEFSDEIFCFSSYFFFGYSFSVAEITC